MPEYISREAVLNEAEKVSLRDRNYRTYGNVVRSIPAADVVEVRHGRWIKDGEDGPVYCSECGEEHEWGDFRASYCDTCGAKMDGGQEE